MIRVIWGLIGLNTIGLIAFLVFYFNSTAGRNVESMEKGWTAILAIAALVVILLAALPLYFGRSSFSVGVAGFFALLPALIAGGIFLSGRTSSARHEDTMAETYYAEKIPREIAAAIEQNDMLRLRGAIQGQDINRPGTRVNDWPGLNYLQFAIRVREKAKDSASETANTAAIRLLVAAGAQTKPALAEATKILPADLVELLLDHGADPNSNGFASSDPLLFEAIGTEPRENDIAILLIKKGANVNARSAAYQEMTPLMFAANNARTSAVWTDVWRVVRYMLEEAHADYAVVTSGGISLQQIVQKIRKDAQTEKITMAADFERVVQWLKAKGIDTAPN